MDIERKIQAFICLGEKLSQLQDFEEICEEAIRYNNWFTYRSIKLALEGVIKYLNESELRKWLNNYKIDNQINRKAKSEKRKAKIIGVVMSGNIPMVGFHDFLMVLLSGHHIYIKLSSQDSVLLKNIVVKLLEIEPKFEKLIHFVDRLNAVDAIIATGSDNSARYFEYYFRDKPHIIRKNRTSCAILDGSENQDEFRFLGDDILQFYGLGCRNVSKLFIPSQWKEFDNFFSAINDYNYVMDHSKYFNNYQYNKAIMLVNKEKHYDNFFLLITENTALVSPISVVYYEHYRSLSDLKDKIKLFEDKIQCLVSKNAWYPESIKFGETQKPHIWDYTDGVDTMEFLLKL